MKTQLRSANKGSAAAPSKQSAKLPKSSPGRAGEPAKSGGVTIDGQHIPWGHYISVMSGLAGAGPDGEARLDLNRTLDGRLFLVTDDFKSRRTVTRFVNYAEAVDILPKLCPRRDPATVLRLYGIHAPAQASAVGGDETYPILATGREELRRTLDGRLLLLTLSQPDLSGNQAASRVESLCYSAAVDWLRLLPGEVWSRPGYAEKRLAFFGIHPAGEEIVERENGERSLSVRVTIPMATAHAIEEMLPRHYPAAQVSKGVEGYVNEAFARQMNRDFTPGGVLVELDRAVNEVVAILDMLGDRYAEMIEKQGGAFGANTAAGILNITTDAMKKLMKSADAADSYARGRLPEAA